MSKKPSYYELLRHPKWQKKRLEIMEEHGFECEDCGATDTTLNIHHTFYEKGLAPWEYQNESLMCLCEPCHKRLQELQTRLHRNIGKLNGHGISGGMEMVLGYVDGLLADFPGVNIEILSPEHAMGVADAFGVTEKQIIQALVDGYVNSNTLSAIAKKNKEAHNVPEHRG